MVFSRMATSNVFTLFLFSWFLLAQAQNHTAEYDYIVVGTGPGGGPLAANLAESGASVLILEAGSDQTENIIEKVPQFSGQAMNDPIQRWDFFVKYHTDDAITAKFNHLTWRTKEGKFYVGKSPPEGATQLGVYYPRAGTLGGCSTHNALASALPSDSDWQLIADLTGDKTWSPSNMRKLFQRIEHNDYLPKNTSGHGFSGYLNQRVINPDVIHNQTEATIMLRETAKAVGQDPDKLPELITADLNNDSPDRDQQIGLFGFPVHMDTQGHRVTAAKLIKQVLNATDKYGKKIRLDLKTNSFVTKVLFDTKGKGKPRAIGVEYLAGESMYAADPRYNATNKGTTKQAFAKKEVIISGGTFNTPQILKLSGVGPKAELSKFNIPFVVDLPGVGTNLQDNQEISIAASGSVVFTNKAPSCSFGAPGDPCLALWYENKGPYSDGVHLDSLQYKTSKAALGERDLFMWGSTGAFKGFWPAKTVNEVPADPPTTFAFNMAKMHSRSKLGTVLLKSSDPRDTPDINFRFYEGEGGDEDLSAMAEGIELGRKIFASEGAKSLGPFVESLPCDPGDGGACDTKEAIKAQTWSHHCTSSAAIGADDDPNAVLDSKFRVRGTEGLRVVDASAFPRSPGGFPVLPTFILSEKATDAILLNK